jgi:pilus assembly protein CpaB
VIVAAVDIKPGQKIDETLIKTVEWPEEVIPPNATTKTEEVIGRGVRFPIGANEVLTMAKLAAEGVGPGLESIIEDGKRGMSIPVKTHESAAGFIKPGSHVDILMVSRGNGDGGKAKTILQNIKVVAVNQHIMETAEDHEKGTVIEMITFSVTPEEAESLALAQNAGSVQLVLRNPLEDTFTKTKGVTQDELLRGSARFSEDTVVEPEDGQKAPQGPSPLSSFLEKLMANKPADVKAEPAPITPVVQFVPPPPEKKKRLIYRDLQGNVLMEVVLDAEDSIVKDLDGLLEDVEPEDALLTEPLSMLTPTGPLAPTQNGNATSPENPTAPTTEVPATQQGI